RAYHKGVIFKILIDNKHHDNSVNVETISQLKELLKSPSEIIPVVNDARSSGNAIDHNKYVLFSEVDLPKGKAKNLVWAASHNFDYAQTKKLEDAILMTNDKLYKAFLENWNQVRQYADGGMKNFSYMEIPVGDSITAFFFPRRKNGKWTEKNTIIEQLNKLSNYKEDTVRVIMSEMRCNVGFQNSKKLK